MAKAVQQAIDQRVPLPENFKKFFETHLAPFIGKIGACVEIAAPHVAHVLIEAYKQWQRLPKRLSKTFWGFCICYFGGSYPAFFATLEAFQTTGGRKMLNYMDQLGSQFKLAIEAEHEEATVIDVSSDPKELAKRKLYIFLRAVDPDQLSEALGGLYSGYMGILLALKVKFARTLALANSIGDNVKPMMQKLLEPVLFKSVDEQYHKWVDSSLKYSCRLFALIIAWRIQKVLSTVHSGLKGGNIIARNLYLYLLEIGSFQKPIEDSMTHNVMGKAFAATGIYFQLVSGGRIPLPFNVIMWPAGILERILEWHVTWIAVDQTALKG